MQHMTQNSVLLQQTLLRQMTKFEYDLFIRQYSCINVNFLILIIVCTMVI